MRWLAVVPLLAGVACATAPPTQNIRLAEQPLAQRVLMEPFYFEGDRGAFDAYTDTDLFRRGAESFDMGEFKAAFNFYRKLIDKFPSSPYRVLAFYNAGLSLERLGDDARALEYYEATRALVPKGAPLLLDIFARTGGLHERAGRWALAARAFAALLEQPTLSEEDRYQFESRLRVAELFATASDASVQALENHIDAYTAYLLRHPELDNRWLAWAQFCLGEHYLARFRAVVLELPEERLKAALERKAVELLRAQNAYMKTLQIKNAEWATAAVYRIGLAYEEFYRELNHAPVPPELNEEEQRIYREELLEATEPVRKKAVYAYDRIIAFANQLSIRTEWVDKARQRVVELRTVGRFLDPGSAIAR